MTAGVAGSYRRLFAEPVLRRLAVADVCARLPQGMMSITLLLAAAQHAPMAVAGLALAGYTLGAAVTAPARGRLADRRGLFPVAAVCLAGYALALLGLLGGSLARGPAGLLVATAAAAGVPRRPPPGAPPPRAFASDATRPGNAVHDRGDFSTIYAKNTARSWKMEEIICGRPEPGSGSVRKPARVSRPRRQFRYGRVRIS